MILFQPCPYHFPDLWKEPRPTLPEITPEQIQAIKKLYGLPEDDSEEARQLSVVPSILALRYAKTRFQNPHGFLVENGHLVPTYSGVVFAIDSLWKLRATTWGHAPVQLSEECFQRARTFELPEESPRRNMFGAMGNAHTQKTWCRPRAQETWPPIE